jgi:hypothetical protein
MTLADVPPYESPHAQVAILAIVLLVGGFS